jgi:hypothetical protein
LSQGADATVRRASFPGMDEAELLLWRIERLQAAIDRLDDGNLNSFGRRMGWKDGSYVGQMLRGVRAISEKFIRRFEQDTGLTGWFNPDVARPPDSLEYQLRIELLNRTVPDHVLQTFLDVVKTYPLRKKTA